MLVRDIVKPDGRALTLYAREAMGDVGDAPSPFREPLARSPHLRRHPLRDEWITYGAYRQDRTFLPPPEYNPLAVTVDSAAPSEAADRRLGRGGVRQPVPVAQAFRRRGAGRDRRHGSGHRQVPRSCRIHPGPPVVARAAAAVACRAVAARLGRSNGAARGTRRDRLTCCIFENRGAEVARDAAPSATGRSTLPSVRRLPGAHAAGGAADHYARHGRGVLLGHIAKEIDEGATARLSRRTCGSTSSRPAGALPVRGVDRADRAGRDVLPSRRRAARRPRPRAQDGTDESTTRCGTGRSRI